MSKHIRNQLANRTILDPPPPDPESPLPPCVTCVTRGGKPFARPSLWLQGPSSADPVYKGTQINPTDFIFENFPEVIPARYFSQYKWPRYQHANEWFTTRRQIANLHYLRHWFVFEVEVVRFTIIRDYMTSIYTPTEEDIYSLSDSYPVAGVDHFGDTFFACCNLHQDTPFDATWDVTNFTFAKGAEMRVEIYPPGAGGMIRIFNKYRDYEGNYVDW